MISIVVALAKNNVIGKKGSLPWYYPEDLKYFRKLTWGHKILMGRKTFESIINRNKKPLPGRKHMVATRDPHFFHPEIEVIRDLEAFLKQDFRKSSSSSVARNLQSALPRAALIHHSH